ncbi:MAG: dihydroorotate dehydrogenase [Candidatus Moranbacteria bacterium]|nr:dihydroorotate dehydrogenase [Candidatus Moranbacteria bacterium]
MSKQKIDSRVNFLGVEFPNPIVLSSGILGMTATSMEKVITSGAGGVTTKSTNISGRDGNPCPKVITYEAGMLNCYGLTNAGFLNEKNEIKELKQRRPENPVIISIFGFSLEEFEQIAKKLDQTQADLVEVNISCPNVKEETPKPFACLTGMPRQVVKLVKKNTKKPIIVKLSPNVTDIVAIAKEVEDAGADAISAINTLGPGMVINIEAKRPVLSVGSGGISGPAIRPLAVRMIYDVYQAVKIPLVGIGGVTTGRDALEMIMAGAELVGVGSGVYYQGIDIFAKINQEIRKWMQKNQVKSIAELVGAAHR